MPIEVICKPSDTVRWVKIHMIPFKNKSKIM